MYGAGVQYPQTPGGYGQPMPQGGNMGVTPPMGPGGAMAAPMGPGMAQPMGMPPAGAMGGMGGPMGVSGGNPGVVPPGSSGTLDPAAVSQILALQGQQGRRLQAQRQIDLANQLRADAGSQLQGRRVGLANVGAAALGSYAAKQQMDKAGTTEGQLDTERQGAAGKYFDLIRGLRSAGGGGGGAATY